MTRSGPPLPIEPPSFNEHGTSREGELSTRLRAATEDHGLLAIDPVAGCKEISTTTVVYDQPGIREIGFDNLRSFYTSALTAAIQLAHVPVKLRGIDRWEGNGVCAVNLLWATK